MKAEDMAWEIYATNGEKCAMVAVAMDKGIAKIIAEQLCYINDIYISSKITGETIPFPKK